MELPAWHDWETGGFGLSKLFVHRSFSHLTMCCYILFPAFFDISIFLLNSNLN